MYRNKAYCADLSVQGMLIRFQYSLRMHAVLQAALFFVCLLHTVIAIVAGFKFYYALAFIVQVLAFAFFCCEQANLSPERRAWFLSGIMLVELVTYMIHVVLNVAALWLGVGVLFTPSLSAALLILCTVLELVLDMLLVYELLPTLLRLWCCSPEEKEDTLNEIATKKSRRGRTSEI